jgi:carbon monoxide dehydrogenase subunit G
MRIDGSTLLPAEPDRVWRLLVDWERQASWMPDVAWVRVLGPERELGARLAVRTKVLGVPVVTDRVVVTSWEPNRRLGVEHRGLVRGRGEWLLTPAPGGTSFAWTEELSMPPGRLGELALRVYGPIQRWILRRSLQHLIRALGD